MRRLLTPALAAGWALWPAAAQAHGGERHLSVAEVMGWWTWDPLVWAGLAAAAVGYAVGAVRLRRRGPRALPRWQVGCFAVGWTAVAVALVSPLDALSDILFSAHMGQHELLMLAGAPLAVMGRALVVWLWALPPGARLRVGAAVARPGFRTTWRALTHPVVVLVVHGAVRWVWHLPALYQGALHSEPVHALQHAMFFLSAATFWWALVYGRYGRLGYGVGVLFVFLTAGHSGMLGALLTFARQVWYPEYAARAVAWQVDPLEDQQLAGLIMWVPAGALMMLFGLGLFAAWMGTLERRGGDSRVERARDSDS